MPSKSEIMSTEVQRALRGPESEWRDYKCPACDAMYFDIEIARAQERHDSREPCKGKIILVPSEDPPKVLATAEFETREFSPSSDPNKPMGMDFSTAIQQVLEGKRVTRLEWNNPEEYLLMFMWGQMNPKTPAGKYLTIHHADGAMHPLYISDGDLAGEDWVVVV